MLSHPYIADLWSQLPTHNAFWAFAERKEKEELRFSTMTMGAC